MAVQAPQAQQPFYQLPVHLALNALNSFCLFDLFDDAMANLLCLQTYVHGTSPRNYYGIISRGADPRLGGREELGEGSFDRSIGRQRSKESPDAADWDSRGKFYVCVDDCRITATGIDLLEAPLGRLMKKTLPRAYGMMSTVGELSETKEENCLLTILRKVTALFLSQFSPTLKFRFLAEDTVGRFQADPTHNRDGNIAAYTEQPISSDHIGLYGTVAHGFSGNLLGRIQNDPWRFVEGLAELILVVALAIFAASTLATSSTATLAITILLGFETFVAGGRFAVPLLFGLLAAQPSPEAPSAV